VTTTDEDPVALHVVAVDLQDTRTVGGHEVLVEVREDPILDHLLEDNDLLSIENAADHQVLEETVQEEGETIVLEVHLQRKIDLKVH